MRTWQVSKCTPYYPRHGHGPFYSRRVLGHVVAADVDGAIAAARARWGNLSDLELEVQLARSCDRPACDCGNQDAYWAGDIRREYACADCHGAA